ncbi:MAG: glycosyltransferase [Ignavibacteriales bacterium]|nr:glycosyltransferase [Ignavibacteriales bacterium]
MKISVLTPTFNCASYIEKCIHSVLDQNYLDFEHIIVDGGSTDNTVQILTRYDHLKWISEKDNGQSDAMNKAFDMSSGDIIVYCNGDDYFEPGIFEHVIKVFNRHTDSQIIVGNLNNLILESTKEFITIPEVKASKVLLPFKYPFPYNPVSYFYKRTVQEHIGPFPIEEDYAMDYWFIIRAFSKFKVFKSEKTFGTFVRTGQNKTNAETIDKNITLQLAYDYCKSSGISKISWFIYNLTIHNVKKASRYILTYLLFIILFPIFKRNEYTLKDLIKAGIRRSLYILKA